MKVILLRDVVGVGQKGTIKEVSDGYAMNRLLPQKLAVAATPEKIKELKAGEKARAATVQAQEQAWKEQARILKDAKVTVRADANEQGHLYQQLHQSDVVERIKKELGIEVGVANVHFSEHIKSVGHATVEIKLGTMSVPVNVFVEKAN